MSFVLRIQVRSGTGTIATGKLGTIWLRYTSLFLSTIGSKSDPEIYTTAGQSRFTPLREDVPRQNGNATIFTTSWFRENSRCFDQFTDRKKKKKSFHADTS